MSSRRTYRSGLDSGRFTSFRVAVKETDLWVAVSPQSFYQDLPEKLSALVWRERRAIEEYCAAYPRFRATLEPYLLEGPAPGPVLAMVRAGNAAGVGPMAAVAGVLAEAVGLALLRISPEVIVENGGDVFISVVEPAAVGVFAGNSPLSGRLSIAVDPRRTPLGICTSSGTVGPSYSRGRADAAVAISPSAGLADAAATALGNRVSAPEDLEAALEFAQTVDGLTGALVICGGRIAAWGDVTLRPGGVSPGSSQN